MQRWNWLDYTLLPLLVMLARFAWLWSWLDLLARLLVPGYQGQVLAPGLLIGVPLLSLTLAHLLPTAEIPTDKVRAMPQLTMPWWGRISLGIGGLGVIALAWWWQAYRPLYALTDPQWLRLWGDALIGKAGEQSPIIWLGILTLIYLWLRGVLDAAQPMAHDDIWGAILAGLLALVGAFIVSQVFGVAITANVGALVILLFASGLLALAFSSLKTTVGLDYALGMGQRRMAKAPQTTRYWLLSVFLVVGGLLAAGLGFVFLIAPEQVGQLLTLIGTVIGWIWSVIALVLIAVAYVIFMLSYLIYRLLEPLLRLLALNEVITPEQQGQPEAEPTPMLPPETIAAMPDAYRWLALALFIVAVLVIFVLVMRKMRRSAAEPLDEVRESIFSTDLLQDQLAKLWQRWFGGTVVGDAFLSLSGEPETRRAIRQTYQQLLASTQILGKPRQRGQTPIQYELQLAEELTADARALTTLTDHYNAARYAADLPSATAAAEAEASWQALQPQLQPAPPDPAKTQ